MLKLIDNSAIKKVLLAEAVILRIGIKLVSTLTDILAPNEFIL
jgi:hypothetical protein